MRYDNKPIAPEGAIAPRAALEPNVAVSGSQRPGATNKDSKAMSASKPRRAPRIAIMGHVGVGNMGDEAITGAVVGRLREFAPGASLVAFSLNPRDTAARGADEVLHLRVAAVLLLLAHAVEHVLDHDDRAVDHHPEVEGSEGLGCEALERRTLDLRVARGAPLFLGMSLSGVGGPLNAARSNARSLL